MRFLLLLAFAATTAFAKSPAICTSYPIGTKVIPLDAKAALTLVVIGDTGSDSAAKCDQPYAALHIKDLAKAIADSGVKPDAMLLVGDNFYECGVTHKDDPKFVIYAPLMQLGVPMYAMLGNHDYGDSGTKCTALEEQIVSPQAQVDHKDPTGNWQLFDRNYVLRWPELADIAIYDTTPVKNQCSNQGAIIGNLFGAIDKMPKGEWRIVAGHHGLYSSGEHGQDCKDGGLMRKLLDARLIDGKVDLYLSGHDHDAEISNLPRRPLFVVSGSGSRLRVTNPKGEFEPNPSLLVDFAFVVLKITPQTLTASIYDIKRKKFAATSSLSGPGQDTPPSGWGRAPVPTCPPNAPSQEQDDDEN